MTDTPISSTYDLKGYWLMIARLCWVILSIAAVCILIAAVLALYTGQQQSSRPCSFIHLEDQPACNAAQQSLHQVGLPFDFPALFFPITAIVEVLPWILVGLLIFLHKSHKPFGFLFSLMLVLSGTLALDETVPIIVRLTYPALNPLINLVGFLAAALIILWYRFPDGRFLQGWMRWIAVIWIALVYGSNFITDSPLDFNTWPAPLPILVRVGFASSLMITFVYRYRNVSDAPQRQQIKWVLASGSIFALVYAVGWLIPVIIPAISQAGASQAIWWLIYKPFFCLASMFVAISIGFSILRYRLWEIDFLINRSLVYGTLSVFLLTIFGGSLVLVSLFVQGQSFIIAFGVTALFAGILFNPARRRVQRFVDRHFYNIYIDYHKKPVPIPATGRIKDVLHNTDFGLYQNLELIGRGGMSEVYKSVHPTLGVTVAIKILPAQLATQAEFLQRFTREAQVVAKLEHPNIVNIFDSGEQDGKHYIVMEYILGKDLADLLKNNGRIHLEQFLPLLHQIAAALDYAHAHGIVHRDIKPSNIMLDKPSDDDPRAILTDFGIAKIINAHTAVTDAGSMLGTLDYIAPEQIQEASHVDGKADIYALGVMSYQMLVGELPFKYNNLSALLIAHLSQPPPNPCEILPDLPEHVALAIERAMSKRPDERFDTATDFALALGMVDGRR